MKKIKVAWEGIDIHSIRLGLGWGGCGGFFKFKDRSESIFKLEKGLVGVTSLTEILNQDLPYSNVMCRGVGV